MRIVYYVCFALMWEKYDFIYIFWHQTDKRRVRRKQLISTLLNGSLNSLTRPSKSICALCCGASHQCFRRAPFQTFTRSLHQTTSTFYLLLFSIKVPGCKSLYFYEQGLSLCLFSHSGRLLLLKGWWWRWWEEATAEGAALARITLSPPTSPPSPSSTSALPPSSPTTMANHLELIQELQQLDKVPSLERLRAAQKRRTQQLKRWAVYEKEMQNKKRKADKKGRNANLQQESKRHVSFAASVALLEASARNDPDEGWGNK